MNREQKAEFIGEIRERFNSAPFVVLTDFKGSSVGEMDRVRRAVEQSGASFQVVKNTLCRRAIEGTPHEKLAEHFSGNIGVLFSGEDAVGAAKAFRDLVKGNDKLAVRAGFFDGDVLDAKGVALVAELPSREDLLSTLLRTIQEGPRQVLGVIQGAPRDLLYLLQNFSTELEEKGA